MIAKRLQFGEQQDEVVKSRLIKWLIIAIVVMMPYQQVYLPVIEGGYLVDILIILLIFVGWGVIWRERLRLWFPLLAAHVLILIGSLLGTMDGVDRAESLTTIVRDMYVWALFYTVINVARDREFLQTVVRVWVLIAVLESLLIVYASVATSGQRVQRVTLEDRQALHELGVPSLAKLPSQYTQARHIVKRTQIHSYGPFLPGVGIGTFANADFTASYLGQSFFLALVVQLKRRRWLKFVAVGLILYAALLTGVSAVIGAIPAALALYVFFISSPRMRLFWVVAGAFAISVALLAMLLAPYFTGAGLGEIAQQAEPQGVAQGVGGIEPGIEDRLDLMIRGWREVRNRPFGLGPHGMRASGVEKNVHNEYVAYLYERGVLGLIGLLLMHATIIGLGVASMRTGDRTHYVFMAGLLAAFTAVLIMDLAHELMRQRDVWMLATLIVTSAYLELRRSEAQRREMLARRWPWAYPSPNYLWSGQWSREAASPSEIGARRV